METTGVLQRGGDLLVRDVVAVGATRWGKVVVPHRWPSFEVLHFHFGRIGFNTDTCEGRDYLQK
jgi:hypothetical protein